MIENNLISSSQYSLLYSMNTVERFTNLTFEQLITRSFESNNFYILGIVLKQNFTLELVDGKNIYKNMMYPDKCDCDDVNFNDTILYLITEKIDDISKCIFKEFTLDLSLPHLLLESDLSKYEDQFKIAQACVKNGRFQDAVYWFLKVVEQGYSLEECAIQFCYDEGIDEKNSLKIAVQELYGNAAEEGDMQAQWNFSLCYSEGIGVEKDCSKEFEWLYRASKQGLACAQCRLGLCFYNGNGVDKDEYKAVKYIMRAAEQNVENKKEVALSLQKKMSDISKLLPNLGDKRSRDFITKEPFSKIAKCD